MRPLRILFVEDHEDSAEVIGELLRDRVRNVQICSTLAEALAHPKSKSSISF